ncbi:hypothetical protein [Azospirillum sp.]|uniref:hypothetical protein n=1 Tax=Azospirillum sp. TaxID=34012 RepID=UPI002D3A1AC7|nr:hypothetical protein [Azospirillum sp.]HYD65090.1 hypothetical protein [Azospirillum sp.]
MAAHRPHSTSGPPVVEGKGTYIARGVGGRLELTGNRLRIVKGGIFGYIITLLGIEGGFVERTVRVSQISSIELDVPVMFFRFIRMSYPGSPTMSGHTFLDMMAENAVLMSLVDNRPFYALVERIEAMMDAEGAPALERLPDEPEDPPPPPRPSLREVLGRRLRALWSHRAAKRAPPAEPAAETGPPGAGPEQP